MNQIGIEITRLTPGDPQHAELFDLCLDRYKDVIHARLSVIEDARMQLFKSCYGDLAFRRSSLSAALRPYCRSCALLSGPQPRRRAKGWHASPWPSVRLLLNHSRSTT